LRRCKRLPGAVMPASPWIYARTATLGRLTPGRCSFGNPGRNGVETPLLAHWCCSIQDCNNPVLAKGLCRKHYMRHPRGGDPNIGCKIGRPPDPLKSEIRRQFPYWSERTFDRYYVAWLRLCKLSEAQGIESTDPGSPFRRALKACLTATSTSPSSRKWQKTSAPVGGKIDGCYPEHATCSRASCRSG
jgi:hypothetical protein